MTVLGTAQTFKRDWLDGFVTAYGRTVRKVPDAYGVIGRQVPNSTEYRKYLPNRIRYRERG